jgi:hypothetical protein
MIPELEQKIVARWPSWFDMRGDLRKTLMPRGFQCRDGWFDLIHRLCERLEPFVSKLNATLPPEEHFEVLQVKQKFGGLRFYVSHNNGAIDSEIERAHLESLGTCENCGRRGLLRNINGWLITLCEGCVQTRTKVGEDTRQ